MSYCSNCIHKKVCGNEGVDDLAMTYCADKREERPTAEWIKLYDNDGSPTMEESYGEMYKCSNCGIEEYKTDFCPHCGARMRGEE